MFKTWSFWKTFFTSYIAFVAGIWGFVEAYTYFENDSLKNMLGSYWWVVYYLVPLIIALFIAVLRNESESSTGETLDQRNRRVMLNHVENFWVRGVLEKSLHGAALLELGIKEDPSAVSYPWAIKHEATGETLLEGKPMLEIFQEIGMGRSLLILGAPGSGKTTMLLELTRQLIEKAREDKTEPIPVVFNLASWKENQSLADWLAEQLNILYTVPKKTAPSWINENRMLLLLDGLDEIKQSNREKCVEAINQFRNEHGLTSIVVCSRIQEYEELNRQISLEGAIIIQPLTRKKVNAYFDKFGKSLSRIKQLLKNDAALRELAVTPLMLSIMTLAYHDAKPGDLPTSEIIEEQRRHIFNSYIKRMFQRSSRPTKSQFTKDQSLRYLSWLARKMIQHNITTYQIEAMQPSWLTGNLQYRYYAILIMIIGGLISGILVGVYFSLFFGLFNGLIGGLCGGPIGIGLIVYLSNMPTSYFEQSTNTKPIFTLDKLKYYWDNSRDRLTSRLVFVLISGLLIGLIRGLSVGLVFILIYGLFVGLLGGLFLGVIKEIRIRSMRSKEKLRYSRNFLYETIIMVDKLKWQIEKARDVLFLFLFLGLFIGLSLGFWVALISGLVLGLLGGLVVGIFSGLVFGIGYGLYAGLSSEQIEESSRPGQRLKHTLSSAIASSIVFGLLAGLVILMINVANFEEFRGGMLFVSFIGMYFMLLEKGGFAIIQHFALRFALLHYAHLPWRLIPLLEFTSNLIFLRRVGGSYIFIHRALMEHFAEMDVERIESGE